MATLITFTTTVLTAALLSFSTAAPSYDGRILGGLLAPEHSFPYLAGLSITKANRDTGTFWCGGSLIAPNFVITAAHCVYGGTINVKVKLGIHDRRDTPLNGDLIDVQSNGITIHEAFNSNNTENDIALIRLPMNVTLTDNIQLIQLASHHMNLEFLQDKCATAAGWGKTADNTTAISEELRYIDVTIMEHTKCQKYYNAGLITLKNICVDGSNLKGTCNGDSGGPLVYQAVDDTRYLIGLTSFGSDEGCDKGYPTAFTSITAFLDWISAHTGIVIN